MISEFWSGKRVLVTGHTGFKGGWLSLWLQSMGAEVHGLALLPPTEPNFFTVAQVKEIMTSSTILDIREHQELLAFFHNIHPEIVLHLAAQPLVRHSYRDPVDTYSVNVMGLVYLLEGIRSVDGVRAVVNVTTDKCYENREWPWGYREYEPVGGSDPYSSSKGCAELITSAYRNSYFIKTDVALATARAGNVIGGGDWATDRLIPDFFRAMDSGNSLTIRSPKAIRPWQHVLEPLSGYITLAERLYNDGKEVAESWNFGPPDEDAQSVRDIITFLLTLTEGTTSYCDVSSEFHEAAYLKLDSSKARMKLGWNSRWRLKHALLKTLEWHRAWRDGQDMYQVTLAQISEYLNSDIEVRNSTF